MRVDLQTTSGAASQSHFVIGIVVVHTFLIIIFVPSVVVCALLTRYVRDHALLRGWVDPPDTTRHLHNNPVPRLGGVALFATVISITAVALLVLKALGVVGVLSAGEAYAILAPATLIFLVGLYDDFHSLSPSVKFGAQVLGACALYFDGLGIHQFDLLFRGSHLGEILGLPLTIFWVLLITNAFNLIDGLDGLAAGAALFSTIVLFVSSLITGNSPTAFLALILAGAIVGFLRFNFNPATIFLGDSGSLFIGFTLSGLALEGSQKASTMVAVAIPVVCFGLPILDVAIAVVRRFLSGKPLFQGDREHIHHRLLKRGFSQRHAVLILYGVSALFGLLSLALLHGGEATALVLMILGIGVCVGVPQLRYQEFKEVRRVFERAVSQKRIIENNLHVRRATESLRTCGDISELYRILVEAAQTIEFDGFRLVIDSGRGFSEPLPSLVRPGPNGTLKCSWVKSGSTRITWELKLALVGENGATCGSFSVFKQLTDKPLMTDINLLSDGFQSALAGAVRRTFIEPRPNTEHVGQKLTSARSKAMAG